MTTNPDQTKSHKGKVGRPKEDLRQYEVEAQLIGSRLPPVICAGCGRGMQPVYIRKRPDGKIDARCSLSGCLFVYTPPRVRLLSKPSYNQL